MKYNIINNQTKEESICDKVTIDGFDYYVSGIPKMGELCVSPRYDSVMPFGSFENSYENECRKVIATNNPYIDIPKVNEAFQYAREFCKDKWEYVIEENEESFLAGYNKSQETHPYTEWDIILFDKWKSDLISTKKEDYPLYMLPTDPTKWLTTKELLQIWKEQQPKILYYE